MVDRYARERAARPRSPLPVGERGERKECTVHVRLDGSLRLALEREADAAGEPLSRTVRRHLQGSAAAPGRPRSPDHRRADHRQAEEARSTAAMDWRPALLEAGRELNGLVRDLNLLAAGHAADRTVTADRTERVLLGLAGAAARIAASGQAAAPADLRQVRANLRQLDELLARQPARRPGRRLNGLLEDLVAAFVTAPARRMAAGGGHR